MTRKEVIQFLPIMQAFAEGKDIQLKLFNGEWEDLENPVFLGNANDYRIKPNSVKPSQNSISKYRPFNNQEECWNEISKHQPFGWVTNTCICYPSKRLMFGWVTNTCIDQKFIITHVGDDDISINTVTSYFNVAFENFTFVDGTPFGVQIEN